MSAARVKKDVFGAAHDIQTVNGRAGPNLRAQDSNQSQIEKLKNEIISRHDDDSVPFGTLRRSNEENQPFFNFPQRAQRIEVIFCVARRSCTEGTQRSLRLESNLHTLRSTDFGLNPALLRESR